MKRLIGLIVILLSIASCQSRNEEPIAENDGHKYVISNLVTKKSQADLENIMDQAGLDPRKVDRFFGQVKFFNKIVKKDLLIEDDYKKSNQIIKYDVYEMQDMLYKKNPSFAGTNCRITSFGLISDKLAIDDISNPDLSIVAIDNASFKDSPIPILDKGEIASFNKFYSPIATENTVDYDYHVKQIEKFWKDAGIKFPNDDKFKLISVFEPSNIEEDKNELFVGHTALIFPMEDGRLALVEKLAFSAPYQLVIFENYDDIYDYLMEIYDYSNDQYPIKPLIFLDDEYMNKENQPN